MLIICSPDSSTPLSVQQRATNTQWYQRQQRNFSSHVVKQQSDDHFKCSCRRSNCNLITYHVEIQIDVKQHFKCLHSEPQYFSTENQLNQCQWADPEPDSPEGIRGSVTGQFPDGSRILFQITPDKRRIIAADFVHSLKLNWNMSNLSVQHTDSSIVNVYFNMFAFTSASFFHQCETSLSLTWCISEDWDQIKDEIRFIF